MVCFQYWHLQSNLNNLGVVEHVLHKRFRIIRGNLLLDRIERIDNVCHSGSARTTANGQNAVLVTNVIEVGNRTDVKATSNVSSVIAEHAHVLWCFQWKSVVGVLKENCSCCSKLADGLGVIVSNVDVGDVSEVVSVVVLRC